MAIRPRKAVANREQETAVAVSWWIRALAEKGCLYSNKQPGADTGSPPQSRMAARHPHEPVVGCW